MFLVFIKNDILFQKPDLVVYFNPGKTVLS